MDFSNKLITEEIKRNDVFDLKFYLELIKKYGKENVNNFFNSLFDVAEANERKKILNLYYPAYISMKLENFEMEFTVYMPTKRRSDNDNFIPKFWLDGFTESGVIVDDDNKHLTKLVLMSGYDKDHPRTEIVIKVN